MNSRASLLAVQQLRQMPREAREQLQHVTGNGLAIVRGLAEQIQKDASKPEFNEARARTIINTVDQLVSQLREMTAQESDLNAHVRERESKES